ncbi:MarR family winged helix-turn-helix transcriptional regulator [Bacillus alveayuensis]|jgi:MarR family transcriptional regulator, protease production regulatory protein HPr|uniref:MarR family winged helix-turn-helix transcriptional regulator n=1 Tax=Aeribacillus alveayuensis TaxID=279215 RepID=UPI0005CCE964|nr:BlaI/MecI/CopY family transcriptional regulator [Bacillus alveayuensis]
MDNKNFALLAHELFNLWRGFTKVMEEGQQRFAKDLGITTAEQHLLRIVYFEKEATISRISEIGLWDLSTVMQLIKRLKAKQLVETKKKENDMRVSYVSLTKAGKEVYEKSQQFESPLFSFIHEFYQESEQNRELLHQVVSFQKRVNAHFNGESLIEWIEKTGKIIANDIEKQKG